ncbi:MAG: hypothetical protein A3E57_01440 [Candidatus Muproteobacteria bacterium RIFCSPHIGHO2_12_FULL_60_33]|uniref:Uncharacterized protein n=1 Tax=Candidatus Muproteobacteria bacterium RIFCSPLOWO2_01_FULL_60_18 TaxID=1817768 RepID=A0A1F6U181_9PROT|nr:MAG: hypothetical protein A3A87_03155 [Candidatus Muproteobacteria bacterium RIFCSPLOWO2_01_FULL_60_18]OGI53616.1 MAG: hypothetical protein A2W42_04285 [Candidatus Muproteobacteria bacterium RIFCSPHIGHO2_01_60_12]OGI56359.1 MAG: hypothetical protein A3E57_01440 [Candidatus Muproteobacteria bacterium RIFCSPHIGHO2_12_FULL_60_33]
MKPKMTKADAVAFRARWTAVNEAERKELRATTMRRKFRQLAALMASVNKFGWVEPLAQEESGVRMRWNRLRKAPHLA